QSLQRMAQQIGRRHEKEASLKYATAKDLQKSAQTPSLIQKMSETAKDVTTKVKDHFHKDEDFYQIQKTEAPQPQKVEAKDPVFLMEGKTFEEISHTLECRLHGIFKEKYNRMLLTEETSFIQRQATRTAEYLHHLKEQNKNDLTYHDVKVLSIRARYELNREDEIKDQTLKALDKVSKEDSLGVSHYADHLSRIEGQLFEQIFREKGLVYDTNDIEKKAVEEIQRLNPEFSKYQHAHIMMIERQEKQKGVDR
ncbi:MAG: hypothetical protein K2X53_03805, partial [Alphaproteobacteria bacterium]|nr:hypothetical protein [Alphaproteobacteria bacterium]